jgi:hypothetical protein
MKRKIIALVMILVFIPSLLLAASTKYTKTEKVTYNPGKLTFDGVNINGTIKIGNATYVNVSELSASLNKNCTKYVNGDISIYNKTEKYDFGNVNWGSSKEDVIKSEKRLPDLEDGDAIVYVGKTKFGKQCSYYYYFINGELDSGIVLFNENSDNSNKCFELFDGICNNLYDQFGNIENKNFQIYNDCPDNLDVHEAIKLGYAYRYANFDNGKNHAYLSIYSDNSTIYVAIQYKSSKDFYNNAN